MRLAQVAILNSNRNIPVLGRHMTLLAKTMPDCDFIIADRAEELVDKAAAADALILWPFVNPALIDYCRQNSHLRYLHLFTSGVDTLVNSEIGNLTHLRITSTKGIHGYPISDHTLALIFAFLRQLPVSFASQNRREWFHGAISANCREIGGLTVGIIGVGSIGLEIARKCKLLGMQVLGAKRSPITSEWLDACYSIAELNRLLAVSDFVVLALPLTDESRHIIDQPQLAVMKKDAILINIARGGVINQSALIEALLSGQIAGAGLDVTDPEPLPAQSPLWDMPNVIITPHTAAQSPQYMDRAISIVAENLRRYQAGEDLMFEIDHSC